ncbi:zinc ABC transporter substrate-binding protein [bacterium]|nr:zinc ABC transporter substrate-binding protein [bacterium]
MGQWTIAALSRLFISILTAWMALSSPAALAEVRVAATLPVLGDIVRQVGGQHVVVQTLAKGTEDPHYVIPRPSLIATVSRADLFVEMGLQLELWTERVLESAGNSAVNPGAAGHVYASAGVPVLEVPEKLTRAEGDIHPSGNPHVWLSPLNGPILAANIAAGLKRVDPERAADYDRNLEAFSGKVYDRMFGKALVEKFGGEFLAGEVRRGTFHSFLASKKAGDLLGGWMKESAALRGLRVVSYHKAWSYLSQTFGLDVRNTIEEKPGIQPSAAHRDRLLAQMKSEGVRVIILAPFEVNTISGRVASMSGARTVVVPANVNGAAGAADFFSLFDEILAGI